MPAFKPSKTRRIHIETAKKRGHLTNNLIKALKVNGVPKQEWIGVFRQVAVEEGLKGKALERHLKMMKKIHRLP